MPNTLRPPPPIVPTPAPYDFTMPPPRPVKVCSCGCPYDQAEWDSLKFVGRMADGEGGVLCLRNCRRCGTTLAVDTWSSPSLVSR